MTGKKIDDAGVTNSAPALLTDYIPIGRDGTARNLTLAQIFAPIGYENAVTAFAGGGSGSATALSSSAKYHRIGTCATAGDSVSIGAATANDMQVVRNDGAAACTLYSASTLNGGAGASGISIPVGATALFHCTVAGAWLVSVIHSYLTVVLTTGATFSGGCTMPGLVLTAASAIVQENASGANTFAGSAAFSSAVTVSGAFNGSTATLSGIVNASQFKASAGLPATATTASAITPVLGHAGMQINYSNATSVTFNIPTAGDVAFTIGAVIFGAQRATGQITYTAASGVTLTNVNSQFKSQGINSVTYIEKTDTNTWNLVGATGA